MSATIRIYDLAKELKQEPKRIIEELRREGADVSVPSNSVSEELADKIRNKYFSKGAAQPKKLIKPIIVKIIKKKAEPSIEVKPVSTSSVNRLSLSDDHWIELPVSWKFTYKEVYDFDRFLGFFDWSLRDKKVIIDFSYCRYANYQALSLLVLYMWHLERNRCDVGVHYGKKGAHSATTMWANMGAQDWFDVLSSPTENFPKNTQKPLFAIRNSADFNAALTTAETYTRNFDVEYEKTLRYIISELLYNTLEHGKNYHVPSLLQFSWYGGKHELSFIVADLGIGIRKHLSQAYPELESDVEAIKLALEPQVSGTFGNNGQPYQVINNAGVGLFMSSNIVKRLRADMYIVSGNGLVHISPTEVTQRTLKSTWHGTFVYVTLKLGSVGDLNIQKVLTELRAAAATEISQAESKEQKQSFYLNIKNYYGRYAEDKALAIKLRDEKLLPAIAEGKSLTIDFEDTELAPHSLLNALLATPVRQLGMSAYKKIKIINASPEIRETIDFILDENTTSD